MLFNTLGFFVFLAVVLILYYIVPLTWRQKKIMLLLASYLFYGLWNPPLIVLLWISTMIDWTAGNQLAKSESGQHRRWWLALSLVANLGILAFFKYGGFLMENFQALLKLVGMTYVPPEWDILLPMGISFYTFQTMSYTIDLYRGSIRPARTFLDFALYVTFFPQLVAGPIVRAGELVPQFYEPKRPTAKVFLFGLLLLTIGLFEKTVFADSFLGPVADKVFGARDTLGALDAWIGVWGFSGQIFFDFAGYSLCAIGLAQMLGFALSDNFRYPYGSIGFSDLWKRWHISLSSWLRDYLYISLGGNRLGVSRTYLNLMLTMLLGGLWHGAAWTFVAWGFLHGLFLVVERGLRRWIRMDTKPLLNGLVLSFLTFTCINITWVFFRSADFGAALRLLKSMFFLHGGKAMLMTNQIVVVGVVMIAVFLGHFAMRERSLPQVLAGMPRWLLITVWGLMIFALLTVQTNGKQFIYFQF